MSSGSVPFFISNLLLRNSMTQQHLYAHKRINVKFFLLQSLIAAISCIGWSFVTPILLRFGYGAYAIGVALTLAALSSAFIKPIWGYLLDRFAKSRQILFFATAAGCAFYTLLILSNGKHGFVEMADIGLYMTIMSMTGFVDTWGMRLINDGYALNYGITRSGGSITFALTGILFGMILSHFGIKPGISIIFVLFLAQSLISLFIPNPQKPSNTLHKKGVIKGAHQLMQNKPYIIFISICFISAISMLATESFFAVRINELGGTEQHVGIGLFLQAISEIPIMFFYNRIKSKIRKGPEFFLVVSLLFYGIKCIGMGMASNYQVALAMTMLNGLSFGIFILASVDFILKYVPENLIATAYLLSTSIGYSFGAVFGNYIDGSIAEVTGVGTMMIITSGFAFLSAFIVAIYFHNKQINSLVKG